MVGQLAPGQVLGNPTASTALPKGTTIAGLGGVVGPASSTTGDVAVFNNATGTLLAVGTTTGTGSIVRANAPSLVSPALDTPTSLTLTNAVGLPIAGISGLNASVATWLASPTSANLGAAVTTTSTGTGSLVFGTGPTFTAATLAGNLSGGGNQINNIVIGASTPLAGTFTQITFSPTTGGIVGTVTNNTAAIGKVGEYIQSVIATAVPMTTAASQNIANIVLTPGDWDVNISGIVTGSATTTMSYTQLSISQVSGTLGSGGDFLSASAGFGLAPFGYSLTVVSNVGPGRVSIATTATTYFVANVGFALNTCGVYGTLRARRVR